MAFLIERSRSLLLAGLLALVLPAAYGQTADSPFLIDTVAGSDPFRDGPATQGLLRTPNHLAVDDSGNLYIADRDNGLVRKVTPQGVISTVAGSVNGYATETGTRALDLWLLAPEGVAAGANGNIYVADTSGYSQVYAVAPDGSSTIVAGSGQSGFSGDGGAAAQARLSFPGGIAADDAGNLYIADTGNHRVRKVSTNGTITTVAGTGASGFSGDAGLATAAQLNRPVGVAVNDAGEVFVADSGNHRVRKIGIDGNITTVAGSGVQGSGGEAGPATQAQLNIPTAVAIGPDGRLYISDRTRVLVVEANATLTRLGGGGTLAGTAADGAQATQAQLLVWGLAVDGQGNIFISEFAANRVRKISPGGVIQTVAGASHLQGDGGAATQAVLFSPDSVTFDGEGGFYIADTANHSVRHVDESGAIRAVAGTGVAGFSGDSGPAAQAMLSNPRAVALDQAGNLYIADQGNGRVRKVDTQGNISTFAGSGAFGSAGDGGPAVNALFRSLSDVKADSEGNVYVVDTGDNRVRVINAAGTIRAFAGTGQAGFSGDGGPATQAQLNFPSEVEIEEAAGNVYIADLFNSRLRVVRSNGTIDTLFQITGSLSGIARDTDGSFYIANSNNDFIERVTADGVSSRTTPGVRGFSGDGGAANLATVSNPQDVTADEAGNLYVADTGNHRIRLLTAVPAIPENALKNAGSFVGDSVAPGSIVSLFGANLAAGTAVATAKPLPTTLAGTALTLTDGAGTVHAVPLFFVSRGQINCFLPAAAALGAATLNLVTDKGGSASTRIQITAVAPGVFTADATGTGVAAAAVVHIAANGARTDSLTFSFDPNQGFRAVPIDMSAAGVQVYLVLFGTGIGNNRNVSVTVGGQAVPVLFAGAQGEFVGLDQANIGPLPQALAGSGEVPVVLTAEGQSANTVTVSIR
jgi:uncharacterized protein (TIGR03437 family)